jgi:hypothetical protein
MLCLFGLFLVLPARAADVPPKANALTAEESADGWSLLFDGEKFSGFRIQGDYEVKDGVLILGGKTTTRLTTTRPLLRNFELRLQYRSLWSPDGTNANAGMNYKETFAGGGSMWSLKGSAPPGNPDEWIELVFKGELDPQTSEHRVYSRSSQDPFDGRFMGGGMSEGAKRVTVYFEVPPGGRLHLRDIKLKADPVGWWDTSWPYLGILAGILLAFCVMLWIAWRILRRRWAMADAKPPA